MISLLVNLLIKRSTTPQAPSQEQNSGDACRFQGKDTNGCCSCSRWKPACGPASHRRPPSSPIPRTSRGAPGGLDPLDGEVREPLGDGDSREGGRLHPTGEEPIPASPPGYGRTTPGSPSSRYLHHRHHPPRRLHSSSPRGFGASVKSLPCLGGADGEAPTGWGDGESVHGGPA